MDLQYTHDLNLAPPTSQLAQMLDADFQAHILALPAVYAPEAYRELIESFGTHFVRRLQLGGAKHLTMLFEEEEEINERAITSEIAGSYGGGGGGASVEAGTFSRSAVRSATSSTQLHVTGGDPTAASDAAWRDSLFRFEPHAFPSGLTSLAVFLPSPQSQHFERAVKEYALEHHLQRSKANAITGEKDGQQWVLGKVPVKALVSSHSTRTGVSRCAGQKDHHGMLMNVFSLFFFSVGVLAFVGTALLDARARPCCVDPVWHRGQVHPWHPARVQLLGTHRTRRQGKGTVVEGFLLLPFSPR